MEEFDNTTEVQIESEKKDGFSMGVWGGIGITVLYLYIVRLIADIPFDLLSLIPFLSENAAASEVWAIASDIGASIIIVMMIVRGIRKKHDFSLKLKNKAKNRHVLYMVIVPFIIGYYLMYGASIGVLTDMIPVPESFEASVEVLFENPYAALLSIAIIGPIYEEFVMRGIILEGMLRRYRPWVAIVASALIFGAYHICIPQAINATFLGLGFGILYYRTKSLMPCIVAHIANNVLVIIVASMTDDNIYGMLPLTLGTLLFLLSGALILKNTATVESGSI